MQRFYQSEWPEVDSHVVVMVDSINELGATVRLLEYGGKEGLIQLSELSVRRIRSIGSVIQVGREEVVCVLRVDESKNCIDLSKKRVTQEEIKACRNRYRQAKTVHEIIKYVCENNNMNVCDLYNLLWNEHCPSLYELFLALQKGDRVLNHEIQNTLLNEINHRILLKPKTIRADISLMCFGIDGIDAIKSTIQAGIEIAPMPISIKLASSPVYIIQCECQDESVGLDAVNVVISRMKNVIKGFDLGQLEVLSEAKSDLPVNFDFADE